LRLNVLKKLRTANLNSKFTGSYKKVERPTGAARASKFTWCCKNRQSKSHFLYLKLKSIDAVVHFTGISHYYMAFCGTL